MTSRERLLCALNGKIPDRVPISTYELSGWNSKAFENIDPSYKVMMDAIREGTDCVCMWDPASNVTFLESSARVPIETTEERGEDRVITRRTIHTPRGPLTEMSEVVDNVYTVWRSERCCKSPSDVDAALSVPYEPLTYDYSDYDRIAREVGDHGILMASVPDALCLAAEMMEFGAFTVWALTETEHFIRTLDTLHERNMENLRRMLSGRVLDLYRIFGPEYASPPYLPPELFARFVTPYARDMVRVLHEHGAKVRLHSHGRIGLVIDAIVATECDALDPCEPPPDGDITLADLKRSVGDRLCLFGNIELKQLELDEPESVERTVRQCMEDAKAGGGYVIMPTASPITSPLSKKTEANYIAFIEAAHRYGAY
ncbi:MAG: uroporphyrinogen decarboxylase family protein [Candidatus Hydrogenedentes bacterium]|nr:uroporphyrinogen decarboxylase family protein [Candidatus Hydrogenedentota bacterium]